MILRDLHQRAFDMLQSNFIYSIYFHVNTPLTNPSMLKIFMTEQNCGRLSTQDKKWPGSL